MQFSFGGNWVDLIFFVVLLYFVLTNSGFVRTALEIIGFLFALLASYSLYHFFSPFFQANFSIPKGFAAVLGFFTAWFLAEIVFQIMSFAFLKRIISHIHKNQWDRWLGYLAGVGQSAVIFLFFVSLIFALPVRGQIKKDILDSKTGPFFVSASRSFETALREVFGQAAQETLNFLTIKPGSSESVGLGFKTPPAQITFDSNSEQTMFGLVNSEREKQGVGKFSFDPAMRDVARNYAKTMLENGFFSHNSAVDGSDAGQRVTSAGISFGVLGENLAYAPDVYLAHQGLMNSEGHRKNILSPEFNKVGIGIADGGIYGKMFVQLFSN